MGVNEILYNTAYEMLLTMKPRSISKEELQDYFVGDSCNPVTLRDVFIAFIKAAQDYSRMPNVIKFDKRKEVIGNILHDFDYRYASTLTAETLYKMFSQEFSGITETSWMLWSNAVIDSAKYISKFKTFERFNEYVTKTSDLKTVPLSMSSQIRGMGFAIASLSLKELGYLDYVKPDVHLIDICVGLDISSKNPLDVFDAMIEIAKDNAITPYKLDKVLWLVCSGNFYKHDIKVGGRKSELIAKVNGKINTNYSSTRLKIHKKNDSDSGVQLSVEKQLVKKLEQYLNISNLVNDMGIRFVVLNMDGVRYMDVSSVNEGPFTLIMDSKELFN